MELTPVQQIQIINAQIVEWKEAAFQAEVAHKVHKRLGTEPARLDHFVKTMQQAEIAIHELTTMRTLIEDEHAPAS